MPLLTRCFIKTSLVYLVVALLVGILPTLHVVVPLPAVGPSQVHLYVVGWLTQLIFGVAFWMFPRYAPGVPYGPMWPGWSAYALLNLGLVMRTVAEPAAAIYSSDLLRYALIASALFQWLAICFAVLMLWPRVKGK